MRSRISIRGYVRPSVRPSHTSWNHAKVPFLTKTTISTSENASYAVYPALLSSILHILTSHSGKLTLQCTVISHQWRIMNSIFCWQSQPCMPELHRCNSKLLCWKEINDTMNEKPRKEKNHWFRIRYKLELWIKHTKQTSKEFLVNLPFWSRPFLGILLVQKWYVRRLIAARVR